jgi:transcriptional regulator with XRE-family HTH domain
MLIGDRLRAFREAKKLSQGEIEERSGLKRSYISRVETGHTIPALESLEKLARALEVPLTSSSMREKSRRSCLISRNERLPKKSPGDVPARKRVI